MELTSHAEVFDRAAPTYDRVGVDFFSVFGERLVAEAGITTGQSVLDIGTGRGAALGPAVRAVGPTGRVVGVDLAPTMVALTAEEFAGHANVEVRQADAAHLPGDLGTFDAVLSSLVLFFTDDPAATLRGWAGHVAGGGRLGLVTFLRDPDDSWFRSMAQAWLPPTEDEQPPAGPSPFELVEDPDWLDARLREAGLEVVSALAVRHQVRFADVEQWWAWVWSHGGRVVLEQLPDDRREAFKAAAGEQLDARRLPDGAMGLHVTVRFTVAPRP